MTTEHNPLFIEAENVETSVHTTTFGALAFTTAALALGLRALNANYPKTTKTLTAGAALASLVMGGILIAGVTEEELRVQL